MAASEWVFARVWASEATLTLWPSSYVQCVARISPANDNQVAWGRGDRSSGIGRSVEIDFAACCGEIRRWDLQLLTTFPCLIFRLCEGLRSADRHCEASPPYKHIGHPVSFEMANVAAPRREPRLLIHTLDWPLLFPWRVEKLEAEMATLLHHIQWMQKSSSQRLEWARGWRI
ncbi:hypothetical protein H5410_042079 [Solanum commersonii]|uniref:Uncharacterized protein n=1 Tax=Solanum commersonii TaxID=4109 RepID=A0A9J5XUQ6_SOLCO|nr:hypothetical protein H5410_042079 [Solanum commersonii]